MVTIVIAHESCSFHESWDYHNPHLSLSQKKM